MNMISKNKLLGGLGLLLLAGCILPGPWDYTPEDKSSFRGIYASAYAVADHPAENVCFERLLSLDEGHTDAFPFYDSASIGISGVFSTGGQSLILQPLYNTPNCFASSGPSRFVRDQTYTLTARFVWDSSGTKVTSVLRAQAHVPKSFRIADTAVAPRVALTGVDPSQAMDTNSIPYQDDVIYYHRKDSVFYIGGNSKLNNLSHYFHSLRSDDVSGVLVVQRYDTAAGGRPVTTFDNLFGIKPDTGRFYYPGDHRRLILDPSTISKSGYNLLDSIGIVNAWYWAGINRLYFYGVEKTYTDYVFTNVEEAGGGSVDQNPKIQPLTNISGGHGFFAGMVADSFDVFIKTDPFTTVYSYPAARAWECRDKGWFGSRDCAGWYREFCRDNKWVRPDCQLDAIYTCADSAGRASVPPSVCDSANAYKARDSLVAIEALFRYCIDKNYPAGCEGVRQECDTGKLGNGCHLILWKSCELNYWKPAACVEGRKSYCRDYGATQIELCRTVNGN